jgi:hypothetical protein
MSQQSSSFSSPWLDESNNRAVPFSWGSSLFNYVQEQLLSILMSSIISLNGKQNYFFFNVNAQLGRWIPYNSSDHGATSSRLTIFHEASPIQALQAERGDAASLVSSASSAMQISSSGLFLSAVQTLSSDRILLFPTIPNNANNNLNSGSSVNSSRPSFSSQMEITFEELNKTRRVIEEHHLQSGLAITSLQTDNALNGQAIAELQGNTGRIIKMEAMLETLIAHIARDPSSTTQL